MEINNNYIRIEMNIFKTYIMYEEILLIVRTCFDKYIYFYIKYIYIITLTFN